LAGKWPDAKNKYRKVILIMGNLFWAACFCREKPDAG